MDELGKQALLEVLGFCTDGVCLVDRGDWQVVFVNPAFRARVRSAPISEQASVFDWLPDLEARRRDLESVADGEAEEFVFEIKPLGEVRARRLGELLAVFLRWPAATAERRVDPLTGLADRAFFLERLETLLNGERAGDHRCVVLFVDVDGFKQINDTYGHLIGDDVLREVARRLAGCVRVRDHVARYGGDEFVVLLESVGGPVNFEPVAERIRAAFDRPIDMPQGRVQLAVSVGAAQAGPRQRSAKELIHAADRAMYAAKRAAT